MGQTTIATADGGADDKTKNSKNNFSTMTQMVVSQDTWDNMIVPTAIKCTKRLISEQTGEPMENIVLTEEDIAQQLDLLKTIYIIQ